MRQLLRPINFVLLAALLTLLHFLYGVAAAAELSEKGSSGLLSNLQITPAQKEQIMAVVQKHSAALQASLRLFLQHQRKLVDAVLDDKTAPDAIRTSAKDTGEQLGDFGVGLQGIFQELGAVLTKEQKAKLISQREAGIARIDNLLASLKKTESRAERSGRVLQGFDSRRVMQQKLRGQLPNNAETDSLRPGQMIDLLVIMRQNREAAGKVLSDLANKQRGWTNAILLADSSPENIHEAAKALGHSIGEAAIFVTDVCAQFRQQLTPQQRNHLRSRINQQRELLQQRMEQALSEIGAGTLLSAIIP